MQDEKKSGYGIVIGAFVVAAAIGFFASSGFFGGKKVVDSDRDLPPVETTGRAN